MAIKLIAMDVDGVLTDGSFWWGPNGEEWKRFHFADIMGLSRARKAGLLLALISGEDSPLIDRLAAKMQIGDVEKSCKDKAAALRRIAALHHLSLDEICFMGDDVNDLPALEIAGLARRAGRCATGDPQAMPFDYGRQGRKWRGARTNRNDSLRFHLPHKCGANAIPGVTHGVQIRR